MNHYLLPGGFHSSPFESERAGTRTDALEHPVGAKRNPTWNKQEVSQSDKRLGQERNEESQEPIEEAEENVGVESIAGSDLGGSVNI